jgi:hypothetical protein
MCVAKMILLIYLELKLRQPIFDPYGVIIIQPKTEY